MSTLLADTIQTTSGGPLLGWTLVAETTASGESTIDVINLTSEYAMYKFIWSDLVPQLDGATIQMRTSSNNGSSWDSSSTHYAWTVHANSMSTSPSHIVNGDNSDSKIRILDDLGDSLNETNAIEITLFNPSGTEWTKFKWEGFRINSSGVKHLHFGSCMRLSAADVNGVRFFMSSGNIESGILKVYGVRK